MQHFVHLRCINHLNKKGNEILESIDYIQMENGRNLFFSISITVFVLLGIR